ncbi:MAG: DUF2269 domain-containing protein [Anaplasmataceae bacterium]|nr:DUF2269 domain-containing protein [Anaplasmataceae bacterium]
MLYLIIKWVHILSSTILFGTGIGSAFYMFVANRRKNISEIYFATKYVVIADWLFTTPAVVIQLISGLWMVYLLGYDFTDFWIKWGLMLYFFVGICWLPVVWMQIKMRDMAKFSLENNTFLPNLYWKMDKWWIVLGSLAFPAMMAIFYLMVFKS